MWQPCVMFLDFNMPWKYNIIPPLRPRQTLLRLCLVAVKRFPENTYFPEMLIFGKGKCFLVFGCISKNFPENIFWCSEKKKENTNQKTQATTQKKQATTQKSSIPEMFPVRRPRRDRNPRLRSRSRRDRDPRSRSRRNGAIAIRDCDHGAIAIDNTIVISTGRSRSEIAIAPNRD